LSLEDTYRAASRVEILSEFRSMVKALHAAGIEVILDAGNTLKMAR
jgi:pullulanase/glycogen debranching enzyme